MKKNYIIALFILLNIQMQTKAQRISIGISAGANFSKANSNGVQNLLNQLTSSNNNVSYPFSTAYKLGAFVEFKLIKNLSLESGIYYDNKIQKYESVTSISVPPLNISANISGQVNVKNIEIPINLIYNLKLLKFSKLQFIGGVYIANGINGSRTNEINFTNLPANLINEFEAQSTTRDIKFGDALTDDIKKTDIGLNLGVGYQISKFRFRLMYQLGLQNLVPSEVITTYPNANYSLKNSNIHVSIGYLIFNK